MRNQLAYIMNQLLKYDIKSFIRHGNRLRFFRGDHKTVDVFPYDRNPDQLVLEDNYDGVGIYGCTKNEVLERILFLIELDKELDEMSTVNK